MLDLLDSWGIIEESLMTFPTDWAAAFLKLPEWFDSIKGYLVYNTA